MTRVILVFSALSLFCGSAAAQQFGQTNQPAVSPMLNLLRPGNSPGFNFYGIVKPQMQFQNDIYNLQNQANTNRAAIWDINGMLVPTTGHSTYFLNTSNYYPMRSSLAGGGNRPGASIANRPSQPSTAGQGLPPTNVNQGAQQPRQ